MCQRIKIHFYFELSSKSHSEQFITFNLEMDSSRTSGTFNVDEVVKRRKS